MSFERYCFCGNAVKGAVLDKFDDSVPEEKKQCVPCWNALNSEAHQKLWRLDEFGEPLPEKKERKRRQAPTTLRVGTGRGCCGGQKNTDYVVEPLAVNSGE